VTIELDWPTDRPEFTDLPTWLASALPGRPTITGPIRVLNVKRWGGTALFDADGRLVVVKHAQPALFAGSAAVHAAVQRVCPDVVAPLLAHADGPGWQRSVFGFVDGPTAEQAGPHALVTVAATLGHTQAALARTDLHGLPAYQVDLVPDRLTEDLSTAGDQDPALVSELRAALPVLRRYAELLAEVLPASVDHPDLHHSNAIMNGESDVVLLDWAAAAVGCPLFSLHRLLADAGDALTTASMIDAYLDALFAGRSPGSRRLLDLAMILAPLKLAVEARAFVRGLDLPHPHTRRTAELVAESLGELRGGRSTTDPEWTVRALRDEVP
jgi:hypothetical protein